MSTQQLRLQARLAVRPLVRADSHRSTGVCVSTATLSVRSAWVEQPIRVGMRSQKIALRRVIGARFAHRAERVVPSAEGAFALASRP